MKSMTATLILTLGLLAGFPQATAADVETITNREGGDAGLVVLVEPEDASLAAELAAGGKHLVVALSADAARVAQWDAALAEAGVHPVADAIHWLNPDELPFPSNKVNALVLDAATAGRLGEEEVRRVINPGHGFALVDGQEIRKPRPEGMDVWLAYNYDGTGNRLSRDTLEPPNSIQFLAAGRVASGGEILITDRVLYHRGGGNQPHELTRRDGPPGARAYDPFSGVVRWRIPRTLGDRHAKRWDFDIFTDGHRLFAPRSDDTSDRELEMMTYDLLTGEIIEERLPHIQWSERLKSREVRSLGPFVYPGTRHIVSDGKRVYQVDVAQTVRALSADGTELLWEKRFADDECTYQVASDGKIVAVVLTSTDEYILDRQHDFKNNAKPAAAIVGLDAATGEQRWRYDGVKGRPIWYLIADFGAVVAASHLHPPGRSRQNPDMNIMVSLDAATGKEHFKRVGEEDFIGIHLRSDNTGMSVNGDTIMYHHTSGTVIFNLRTGEVLERGSIRLKPDFEPRHTIFWTAANTRWLLGDGTFVSYDGSIREEWASRLVEQGYMGFAQKPANNMLYTRPAGNPPRHLGDLVAMAREEHFPDILPDDRRLLVRGRADGVRDAAPADWPTFRGDFSRRAWRAADGPAKLEPAWTAQIDVSSPQGAIPSTWALSGVSPGVVTQPVADSQRVLVAVPERHELICLDLADGSQRWATRLSGRVTAPPTLAGNVAFVGVNDGTVSAINLEDGSVIWTFLAAPYERLHNVYQQLESTHPVNSSPVLLDGTLYVAAGRHGSIHQGILVWALDPATGEPKARQTVTHPRTNCLMQVVGDRLRINFTDLHPDTLDWRDLVTSSTSTYPAETDAPFIYPRTRGHHVTGMGWTGPNPLWSGYYMFGREGSERRHTHVILTDDHFAVASVWQGGIRYRELSRENPALNQPTRSMDFRVDMRGSFAHGRLTHIFAGAGRYRYALNPLGSRSSPGLYLSAWDASQDEPELSQVTVEQVHEGETLILDGIAIAHGHVIVTTTEGRVLAFKEPE
ncbi:MAG: PQQ-binding-like beta-propeller repeat protein [Phycisphaeraceae bacterium]|nr:PQQ-binding-like beta-propeller repeat protein [Phycisphaeraceae bacterium]